MRSAKGNELEDPRVWTEEITGVPKGSAAGILGMVAGHAAMAVLEAPAEVANMIRRGARAIAQRGLGGGGSAAGAAVGILPKPGAGQVELFHGTTQAGAESILADGLMQVSQNTAPYPAGSFFTLAGEGGQVGASHWAASRATGLPGGTPTVLRGTLPQALLRTLLIPNESHRVGSARWFR